MTTSTTPTVVAVLDSREHARRAVEELREAGFPDAQLGVGARGEGPSGPPTWETGAGIGGLLGASLGGLAAGPPGMAGGAVVGLLLGAMIDLGVNEEDARWYSDRAEAGGVVVAVRADGRDAEAREILRRHGGREAPPSSARSARATT